MPPRVRLLFSRPPRSRLPIGMDRTVRQAWVPRRSCLRSGPAVGVLRRQPGRPPIRTILCWGGSTSAAVWPLVLVPDSIYCTSASCDVAGRLGSCSEHTLSRLPGPLRGVVMAVMAQAPARRMPMSTRRALHTSNVMSGVSALREQPLGESWNATDRAFGNLAKSRKSFYFPVSHCTLSWAPIGTQGSVMGCRSETSGVGAECKWNRGAKSFAAYQCRQIVTGVESVQSMEEHDACLMSLDPAVGMVRFSCP